MDAVDSRCEKIEFVRIYEEISLDKSWKPTLQFLHLQTKLASPRLPLISLSSWLRNCELPGTDAREQKSKLTKRLTPT
jgi:hypothetical protein